MWASNAHETNHEPSRLYCACSLVHVTKLLLYSVRFRYKTFCTENLICLCRSPTVEVELGSLNTCKPI